MLCGIVGKNITTLTSFITIAYSGNSGHDWLWFHFFHSHSWSFVVNLALTTTKIIVMKISTCWNFHYDYFCRSEGVVNRNDQSYIIVANGYKWLRLTTIDHEWIRMTMNHNDSLPRLTTNDANFTRNRYIWLWMAAGGCEWQWLMTIDHDWPQLTTINLC